MASVPSPPDDAPVATQPARWPYVLAAVIGTAVWPFFITMRWLDSNPVNAGLFSYSLILLLAQTAALVLLFSIDQHQTGRSLRIDAFVLGLVGMMGSFVLSVLLQFDRVAVTWLVGQLILIGCLLVRQTSLNYQRQAIAISAFAWLSFLACAGMTWYWCGMNVRRQWLADRADEQQLVRQQADARRPEARLARAIFQDRADLVRQILKTQPSLSGDEQRRPPLEQAVALGRQEIARELLSCGADPNLSRGEPLVHLAVKNGRGELALELLRAGADYRAVSPQGVTVLQAACASGYWPLIQEVLDSYPPAERTAAGESALTTSLAVLSEQSGKQAAHRDNALRLMRDGFRPPVTSQSSARLCRIFDRGHDEVGLALVQHGVSMNYEDNSRRSPLDCVIGQQDGALLAAVLPYVDEVDETWRTRPGQPLRTAISTRQEDLVQILLDAGAQVHTYPQQPSNVEVAFQSKAFAIATLLIDRGAEIKDDWVFKAIYERDRPMLEALLRRDIDVGELRQDGESVLHKAARSCSRQIMELLIEHGADVNALEREKRTPLFFAVYGGNSETAQCLIDHGADIHTTNLANQTALDVARQGPYFDVVKVLEVAAKDSRER